MEQENYWQRALRRRMSRRQALKAGVLAGAGITAASFIGCGGGSGASTPTAGQSRAAQEGKAQRGGALRFATASDASTLDPQTGVAGGDDWFWYALFDNLVAYDQDFVTRPELSLAEKWEIPDPQKIVFTLRNGVKFHDGTPFNAQAVKVNIERVQDPKLKSTARASFLVVDKVEVVDDYHCTFHLKEPSAALLYMLGGRGGTMSSPAALEKYGDEYGVHPTGTGPFQMVEWVKGSYAAFKRNDNYWGKDKDGNQLPYVDQLKYLIIPDATVSLANLQTGDVDIVGVSPENIEKVKNNKNLDIEDGGGGISSLLVFNLAKSPMDDMNLRLAVAHAMDPDAINKAVHFGDAIVAKAGMWPPGTWVYNESVPRPSYDPKKAKEYLAKAGKPNGFSMPMITYSASTIVQNSEMIKAQLAEVGIKVEVEVRDVGQATSSFFADGAFPLFSTAWSRYPEPDWIASLCYKSNGYYNAGKVKNDKLDALIAKGAATYDVEERKKIYNQINEIVLGEAIYVPLLYGRSHMGYNAKVQNMKTFFGGEAKGRFKELWIKQ